MGIHNEGQQVQFLELIANQTSPSLIVKKTCHRTDAGKGTVHRKFISKIWHFFYQIVYSSFTKNIWACKKCLCKKIPSSGKICAKFYAVLLQKRGMLWFRAL